VFVADNASTDNSLDWLKDNYINVEVIALKSNYGFAKGYNLALKQIEADYYVLLNSDVEVAKDWIEPVIELMETNEKVAACQPKILSYSKKDLFEYAGAAGGWIDALGYPFSRGRVFDACEKDMGQYDEPALIFWASGAAMFVKASVFHKMQGFDEFFFAHQEEIDLCWRMQLAGYMIMACPSSIVYHVGGGTLPKGERKVFLNFRNNLIMVYKNWKTEEIMWKLPLRIVLDILSAIKSLIAGDAVFFKGVLKALSAFFLWTFSNKKKNNFLLGESRDLQGLYKGSIVWQYFIKKKNTFTKIVTKSE
jgi:GT2 family glycosyltransferase